MLLPLPGLVPLPLPVLLPLLSPVAPPPVVPLALLLPVLTMASPLAPPSPGAKLLAPEPLATLPVGALPDDPLGDVPLPALMPLAATGASSPVVAPPSSTISDIVLNVTSGKLQATRDATAPTPMTT